MARRRKATRAEMQRAHNAVAQALKDGRLQKPSQCCGCIRIGSDLVAHHEDYHWPLAVWWLCRACHDLRHMELRGTWPPKPSKNDVFV